MITIPRLVLLASLATVPLTAGLITSGRHASAEAGLEDVSLQTPSGTVRAVMAIPATVPAPAVLLIHGSGGLIDIYKTWARQFAEEGFVGLAVDEVGLPRMVAWVEWLKKDPRTNGKVGIVGWSSGGHIALSTSSVTPVEATVLYVAVLAGIDLSGLKGPVLAHLGERDQQYSRTKVEAFERQMRETGKSLEVYWYSGDHFFPFPDRPSYDKELADTAWSRTTNFLHKNLQ